MKRERERVYHQKQSRKVNKGPCCDNKAEEAKAFKKGKLCQCFVYFQKIHGLLFAEFITVFILNMNVVMTSSISIPL